MPTSILTRDGRTTIPREIRKYLNLRPGQKLHFVIDERGHVVLYHASVDVRDLKGLLYRPDRHFVRL